MFANLFFLVFFLIGPLNAKFTADKIIEAHIKHRSCPFLVPRLSSRGDFLVRLRLANLRPGWQRFKSTWADLELGCKNSVTRNSSKRGCSRIGLNVKRAAELWVQTWDNQGKGHPKNNPWPNTHLSTHPAPLSFIIHAALLSSSRRKCYFFRRLAFPVNYNCLNKSQFLAQLMCFVLVWVSCGFIFPHLEVSTTSWFPPNLISIFHQNNNESE